MCGKMRLDMYGLTYGLRDSNFSDFKTPHFWCSIGDGTKTPSTLTRTCTEPFLLIFTFNIVNEALYIVVCERERMCVCLMLTSIQGKKQHYT